MKQEHIYFAGKHNAFWFYDGVRFAANPHLTAAAPRRASTVDPDRDGWVVVVTHTGGAHDGE